MRVSKSEEYDGQETSLALRSRTIRWDVDNLQRCHCVARSNVLRRYVSTDQLSPKDNETEAPNERMKMFRNL